jgi:hypothetical protein
MPDHQHTDVTILLDTSAGMQPMKTDIERGFDAFTAEQRAQPGVCTVSLAQFDDHYRRVWSDVDITRGKRLSIWPPRGAAALLDAIGWVSRDTQERLDNKPDQARPGAVILGIITASQETTSTIWTFHSVKSLIEANQARLSWVVAYLGANQDAIEVASTIGVSPERAMTFTDRKSVV